MAAHETVQPTLHVLAGDSFRSEPGHEVRRERRPVARLIARPADERIDQVEVRRHGTATVACVPDRHRVALTVVTIESASSGTVTPLRQLGEKTALEGGHHGVVVEGIGDATESRLGKPVHVTVRGHRPGVAEAAPRRPLEPWTEAVQAHRAPRRGGIEVPDRGQQRQHALVIGVGLPREAVHQVPGHAYAVLPAPPQEHDVLQRAGSLPHETKDRIAQALDARLDAGSRGSGQPDLAKGQRRPSLEVQRDWEWPVGELRQHAGEKAR